mgnify:CR=1 FL=1
MHTIGLAVESDPDDDKDGTDLASDAVNVLSPGENVRRDVPADAIVVVVVVAFANILSQ